MLALRGRANDVGRRGKERVVNRFLGEIVTIDFARARKEHRYIGNLGARQFPCRSHCLERRGDLAFAHLHGFARGADAGIGFALAP